jgi:hypothetical protein
MRDSSLRFGMTPGGGSVNLVWARVAVAGELHHGAEEIVVQETAGCVSWTSNQARGSVPPCR